MDAKTYLNQAKHADRQVRALHERRKYCLELENDLGDQMPPSLKRLNVKLAQRVDAWAKLTIEIETVIDAVEDEFCREVLRYRYLNGLNWKTIASMTHYSYEWLYKTHAKGLRMVDRILGMRE